MAPRIAPLPRSDSKARLLKHLGLDMNIVQHRKIYNIMKLEASEGRRRIIASLGTSGQPAAHQLGAASYTTSQIDERTMDAEVRHIFENAQIMTRPLYDLGHDADRPETPNWIIRWMLWHVFRYRDGRQKQRNDSPVCDSDVCSLDTALIGGHVVLEDAKKPEPKVPSVLSSRQYFDPIREQWSG